MTLFQSIPALVRLLILFIFIIICIRKKISLGNTFLAGALFMGFLFAFGPMGMFKSIVSSVIYPKTFLLAIIISQILVLSNSMERTGQMQKLLNSFKGLVENQRLSIIVFPALIGLLPMPGGAVFSAPMVKELGKDSPYTSDKLCFINYWFRHIWEYWWPMYPGILLITVLSDIGLDRLMLYLSPFTLFALLAGYFLIRESDASAIGKIENDTRPSFRPFIRELLPIILVIVPGLSAGFLFSYFLPNYQSGKETGLILALMLAIAWVFYDNRLSPAVLLKMLSDPQMLKMIYMIFAILIFKGMLEDSAAVSDITRELTILNIPLVLIVAVLPFLVGAITGITIAYVGSTFPILIPLAGSIDPAGELLFYIMLAFISGFIGVILSPVHLCFILSCQYFKTSMWAVYRHLIFPSIFVSAVSFVYFYLSFYVSKIMA